MKLYTAKLSPYAARCRMQIYAKNLPIEFIEAFTEVSKEQVSLLNPMGKIPIFEDGDMIIPESEIICEYLEDRFPDKPLRPQDPSARATMRLLSRISDWYVLAPLLPLFAHLSRKRRDPAAVDRQLGEIDRGLKSLEHFIGPGKYAVGNTLTLADCSLAPTLLFIANYLPYFEVQEPFREYPRVATYWKSVGGDPVAARVIQEIRDAILAKSGG